MRVDQGQSLGGEHALIHSRTTGFRCAAGIDDDVSNTAASTNTAPGGDIRSPRTIGAAAAVAAAAMNSANSTVWVLLAWLNRD